MRSSSSNGHHLPCDCSKLPAISDSSAQGLQCRRTSLGSSTPGLACCFPGQLPPHPMEISLIPERGGGALLPSELAPPGTAQCSQEVCACMVCGDRKQRHSQSSSSTKPALSPSRPPRKRGGGCVYICTVCACACVHASHFM